MSARALWSRIGFGLAAAAALLLCVPPPGRSWPPLAALVSGTAVGVALFAVLERRVPMLPRPRASGLDVWLGKHAVLALWAAVEEVVWRWTALGQFARVVPAAAALALVSVGFALWHRPCRPEHLVVGTACGALFLAGGIVAAWAAHAAYNGSIAAADESLAGRPEEARS